MLADGNYVELGCDLEKVLGYKYSTDRDSVYLSPCSLDKNAKTKREILCYTSKIFDPIGLCLPVTVRSKLIMRDLWAKKLNWDDVISDEYQSTWSSLYSDLSRLSSLQFPRYVINDDEPNLYLFSDA